MTAGTAGPASGRLLRRLLAVVAAAALVASACNGDGGGGDAATDGTGGDGQQATTTTTTTTTTVLTTTTSATAQGPVELAVTEVVGGLDTPWALAWDSDDRLWFTERPGRLTRLGEPPIEIAGVVEEGESGLMGLEIDGDGRLFLMYTTAADNRVTRRQPDGSGERVLVSGIPRAAIHDGGRIRFGPDGTLYASTGDAAREALAQDPGSLAGKILAIDPDTGDHSIFSLGHRNAQGLCFSADGRFLSTEHGPQRGDEVNVLREGFNGGWPRTVGNGIHNWTPTIAPAGCAVYDAELIPQWRGSLLLVTLKDRDLRRLTFGPGGEVTGEEVLFDGEFGRLRAVRVGPDGAVYLSTSNRDGRGDPRPGDDRILRIAPRTG